MTAGKMMQVVKIGPETKYKNAFTHQLVTVSTIGGFAMEMARSGMMMATPTGGTNPDGSQKVELMTPHQVVDRAVEIAKLTFDSLEREGWSSPVPPFEELLEDEGRKPGFTK